MIWLSISSQHRGYAVPDDAATTSPRQAAASVPPTASRRCSVPGIERSPGRRCPPPAPRSLFDFFAGLASMNTPRPVASPSVGLTTPGRLISTAASQASSGLFTSRPSRHGNAAGRWQEFGPDPCPGRWSRRWRWCGPGLRGPDAAQGCTVANLHQVGVGDQADGGDVTVVGGVDDAGRTERSGGICQCPERKTLTVPATSNGLSSMAAATRSRPRAGRRG